AQGPRDDAGVDGAVDRTVPEGAQQLAEVLADDDARVAPRADERAPGEPTGQRGGRGTVVEARERRAALPQGEPQVRAGVGVRDREDVEGVELGPVGVEDLDRAVGEGAED